MTASLTRRDFLKLLIGASAAPVLHRPQAWLNTLARMAKTAKPNILILVYDTLSAGHMSMYGYPRDTTPHLNRFAEGATVFHSHYAAGNFTTPGTASLLTGVYPWTHRAFNIAAPVENSVQKLNLFKVFAGEGYYRLAYTHNLLADYFLHQFREDIELHLPPNTFFLLGTPNLARLFRGDPAVAYRSGNFISRIYPTEKMMPSSLFLSLLNEAGLEQYEAGFNPELAELFPDGLPEEGNSKSFFLLEQAIDGIIDLLHEAPQPFLAYFHLYPPHHPYHPRREFIGRFRDQWAPAGKPPHFFSEGQSDQDLNERRAKYDDYLAYADSEFGRLYDSLSQTGVLENTWVVFTSDHGEMFERGIKGHNAPVLFNPLMRVPLLVHQPGQVARQDIYTPTSCTDLLPSLAAAAGRPVPDGCEGLPLPLFASDPESKERVLYALDARQNARYRPLQNGTIAMVKNEQKLIAYYGYQGYDHQFELYEMESDPQETRDLFRLDVRLANSLKDEMESTLDEVNRPFRT